MVRYIVHQQCIDILIYESTPIIIIFGREEASIFVYQHGMIDDCKFSIVCFCIVVPWNHEQQTNHWSHRVRSDSSDGNKTGTVRTGDHIPAGRRCQTCLKAVNAMI